MKNFLIIAKSIVNVAVDQAKAITDGIIRETPVVAGAVVELRKEFLAALVETQFLETVAGAKETFKARSKARDDCAKQITAAFNGRTPEEQAAYEAHMKEVKKAGKRHSAEA